MRSKLVFFSVLVVFALAAISCGPSPEAVATMTAAAWTPTPLPTPTPTPVPYGLLVQLSGEEGAPVTLASVSLAEAGDEPQAGDDSGEVSFVNLPGETVTLSIVAPGYLPSEVSETIERGDNTVAVTLEVDPDGLLPANACAEGETLLSIEDFQDNQAQDWGGINNQLASGVPGVEISEDENQPGNLVFKYSSTEPGHIQIGNYDGQLGNAAARFKTRNNGGQHLHVGWHSTDQGRYIAFIYAEQAGGRVEKFVDPDSFQVFNFGGRIGDGEWHTIEVATYEGTFSLWIDGVESGSWEDQQPLPAGELFLDADFWDPDREVELDDISICELSAPFASLYAEIEE
jgi:hypothetical protein